ncbi:MAG: glycosyltransferase [Nitrospirae bacterium]|nr:glycosyltransferase [Nitrospirota bacterium]
MDKTASVIIPTLNAGTRIVSLIGALKSQSAPIAEIIVIDSSSSDDTVRLAASRGCKTIVIPKKEFSHGKTRNLAAQSATGDTLVFMTQDAIPLNDGLIENLQEPLWFTPHFAAASFARQVCRSGASPIERFCRQFNYPEEPMVKNLSVVREKGIKTFFFSNVCSAIKRDVFFDLGGFHDRIIMNEDMLFASKMVLSGLTVVYQPKAVVVHSHNYSLIEQFRRNFDIGVSLKEHNLLAYIRPEGEGKNFILKGTGHFLRENGPYGVAGFLVNAIFRYCGYAMGVRYKSLPPRIRRSLSIHPFYFD